MTTEIIVGLALILVAAAFNMAFARLASAFDYPDILRHEPGETLARFAAGGTGLVLLWWTFMLVAVAFIPVGVALAALIAPATTAGAVAAALAIVAGLVQAIGLVRWPFLVPELARRHAAATTDESREAIELVFAAIHRLLGVGIGEHLGYLLTAAWTLALSVAITTAASPVIPAWLAIPGVLIGLAISLGSLEFVGPHERSAWWLADKLIPFAYIGWSAWLIALGIFLIVH